MKHISNYILLISIHPLLILTSLWLDQITQIFCIMDKSNLGLSSTSQTSNAIPILFTFSLQLQLPPSVWACLLPSDCLFLHEKTQMCLKFSRANSRLGSSIRFIQQQHSITINEFIMVRLFYTEMFMREMLEPRRKIRHCKHNISTKKAGWGK